MSSQIYAPILRTQRLTLVLYDNRNSIHQDNVLALLNAPETIAVMGDLQLRTHGQVNRIHRSALILPVSMPHRKAPGRDDYGLWFVHLKAPSAENAVAQANHVGAAGTAGATELGPVVGGISIAQRSAEVPPDMGWVVLPSYWGQGYATEAGREVFRYATQDLGLQDLIAFPLETNIASIRTAKKIGFVDGGKIRDRKGNLHMVFIRPEMEWRGDESMTVNLVGNWAEEEEVCPCSRCKEQDQNKN